MAHRHREVSRIEGFSDAVFAFSITLLVVSLEVPRTFHELMQAMRGFPAFAVCFALLFQVWRRHYRFFRSYDLEDNYVVGLTGVLLFVVMFYVYPLKFLWSLPFSSIQGRPITDDVITLNQVPFLFLIYGAGVVAVFGILALLYGHAYRMRDLLGLTPAETLAARVQIYSNAGIMAVGLLSMVTALVCRELAPHQAGIAGFIYCGIGLVEWRIGEYHRRMRERLLSRADTSPA
jgi:uncharacterized membrane protein